MARTTLTAVAEPGSYTHAGVVLTMTAADVPNMNQAVLSGNEMLVAHNTGASPYTVTVTSAPDEYGRTKDIAAESIAAGAYKIFGRFKLNGWRQSDGRLYFQASNASVLFGLIRLSE